MLFLQLIIYMTFLNFVLESSRCSKSLTVSRIVMLMERLEKGFFEKNSDTTMQTCKPPSFPPPPPPPSVTRANMSQHVLHTRLSCAVLFKFMETRKMLLLLLAIFLDSDDNNQGKVLDWHLQISLAKGYSWKFVQHLKTLIHVAVLSREDILLYIWKT